MYSASGLQPNFLLNGHDCAIDLLPGAQRTVYPLSILEQKAIEEYIQEVLQQHLIRPSTSPAASSFFLVAK